MDNNRLKDLINEWLKEKLPTINENLPQQIKSAGLDPWENVTQGEYSPGTYTINLPFHQHITATVDVNYDVQHMVGLSTLQMTSLDVTSLDVNSSQSPWTFTAQVSLTADLSPSPSLVAEHVSGSVTARADGHGPSAGITGSITATTVQLIAGTDAVLNGSYSSGEITLESMQLTSLSWSYATVNSTIDGFPSELNSLLKTAGNMLSGVFEGWIKSGLTPTLEEKANSELENLLPITFPAGSD